MPGDRATSASEQRSKCLPLCFQSIFRARFNGEGGGKKPRDTKHNMKREKRNSERARERKHDHTGTKPVVLGSNTVVQQARALTRATVAVFSLSSSSGAFSLADKDTANLFRRQGHGWCRQTLLHSVPLRRPSPRYFVFPESIVARNARSGARRPSAALRNLIPVTHLLCYDTLALRGVTILLLWSPPLGSPSSFPPRNVFFRQIIRE